MLENGALRNWGINPENFILFQSPTLWKILILSKQEISSLWVMFNINYQKPTIMNNKVRNKVKNNLPKK